MIVIVLGFRERKALKTCFDYDILLGGLRVCSVKIERLSSSECSKGKKVKCGR